MNSENHLDTLLGEAKNSALPLPSNDLIARVLADAAEQMPAAMPAQKVKKPSLLKRILAPIGGFGGAFALGTCATIGVIAGAGYADTLYSIPGLDSVLAAFTDTTDTTTPFETLTLLMAET